MGIWTDYVKLPRGVPVAAEGAVQSVQLDILAYKARVVTDRVWSNRSIARI